MLGELELTEKEFLTQKKNISRMAPVVIPPILLAGGVITTSLLVYRMNKHQYFTEGYSNALSYYFGFNSHMLAVLAGGFIGAEILNFHEPLSVRYIKKGRRFYFPLIIMSIFALSLHLYDKMNSYAFVPFITGATALMTLGVISRIELAVSSWNFRVVVAF